MYAKKIGMDLQTQNYLAEARIRGERKLGTMLKKMVKSEGGRPKTRTTMVHVKTATLAASDTLMQP